MPAFIIFKRTSSHVGNKDQDDGTPPHHGVHSRSMVCLRCLVRLWTTMNTQKTPLSHWRWSFHANSNEVPSLIIKTAGISLTNKEELSATPLDDKDNQGETWVYISNGPQLVNQESTKIKKGWWKKSMQLSISSLDGAKTKLNVKKGPAQWTTSSRQQVNRISLLQVCLSLITSIKWRKTYGISNQALCNIKSHSQENSIIQLDFAFCKIQVWGMEFFKSSHVMLQICLGHPCLLWWAQLVKSLTSKHLNNHAPLVHHTYSYFYLNLLSLSSFLVLL